MPLNLDRVAAFVEDFALVDRCRIQRMGSGEDEIAAHWNETTGSYEPTRVDTWLVYTGICMVYTRSPQASEVVYGGAPTAEEQFYLTLPRHQEGRERILPEDIVTVLESQDERLVGSLFRIEAVDEGTHLATREVRMCRYTGMVP